MSGAGRVPSPGDEGEGVAVDVPGLLTGRECAPTEQFGEPFSAGGYTFQTWWCACGNGVNAQVEPEHLLARYAREHLTARAVQ